MGIETSQNRRKTYLIDPHSQWAFIQRILLFELSVAVPCILLTAVVGVIQLVGFSGFPGIGFWLKLFVSVLFLCLLLGGFLVLLGIRVSNRIYGPLSRFQDALVAASVKGEIPDDISLRTADEMQNLVKSLNAFFERLRKDRDEREKRKEDLLEELDTVVRLLQGPSAEDARKRIGLHLDEIGNGVAGIH